MINRLIEFLLGLDAGFLSREGELSVQWNPRWPGQELVPASVWNLLLAAIAVMLVVYVYRREARSLRARVILGVCRAMLLALVLVLLNRPVLTLVTSRIEPSVLAIMIDDSVSMRVRDVKLTEGSEPQTRLESVLNQLTSTDQELIRKMAKLHEVRLYSFDRDAQPLASIPNVPADEKLDPNKSLVDADLARQLAGLTPDGQNTQVLASLRSVLTDLQGQRLAGVVVLTDGRDTPASATADAIAAVKSFGVKVYPVVVGSDQAPRNVDLQSVSVQDAAFKGDIVNVQANVRGSGFDAGHTVRVILKNKKTGLPIQSDGKNVETTVTLKDGQPVETELQFKSDQQLDEKETAGVLDLIVEAVKEPGEIDDADNVREAQVSILEAKISVLYVDGYPRWEYRYIKNEMMRDKTVDISCLLTSADPAFVQEGDRRITRFPESMPEIMEYDVVVFGDVDPKQFTDRQLQMVSDFVSKFNGGFGMVAGPRWSPRGYRNTAIEALLPVNINRLPPEDTAPLTVGWRPVLTREGEASTIFRFYPDKERNARFLAGEIQPLFWYQKGVTVKPGVGEVYAEHPADIGPDGRKSPLLVMGRFGAGRTMFSAYDDSWRWRFYTGESVFDTYWVQQLRYLARSKKLGQRRITLASVRPAYELGEQVQLQLRVIDPQLLQQLPDQIRVDVTGDTQDGGSPTLIRQETLVRQEGKGDLFVASFTADRVGKFTVKTPTLASGVDSIAVPVEVIVPRLELNQPQVNRSALMNLALETDGKLIELASLKTQLPELIPSGAKILPRVTPRPLWDAPLALALFLALITIEWIVRKWQGMV